MDMAPAGPLINLTEYTVEPGEEGEELDATGKKKGKGKKRRKSTLSDGKSRTYAVQVRLIHASISLSFRRARS